MQTLTVGALLNSSKGRLYVVKAAGLGLELTDRKLALGSVLNFVEGIRGVFDGDLITLAEWLQVNEHPLKYPLKFFHYWIFHGCTVSRCVPVRSAAPESFPSSQMNCRLPE